MGRKAWMVVIMLGLGTAVFFWLVSQMFLGSISFGLLTGGGMGMGGLPISDVAMTSSSRTEASKTRQEIMPVSPYGGNDGALDQVQRDYEMWSSYSVVADDVTGYMTALKSYVSGVEGRVLSTSMSKAHKYAYGQLTLKVPVSQFDETNNKVVADASEVVSEQVEAADITGTTVSLEEQKQKLEEQKLELELKIEAASNAAEKRRLELQLEQLEAQIDDVNEQMEVQEERIEYATVSVMVANDADYFGGGVYRGDLDPQDQIQMAWEVVRYILERVLVFIIWAAVFAVLWLPLVLLVVFVKRWRVKKSNKKAE